jgi:hypothetical protein
MDENKKKLILLQGVTEENWYCSFMTTNDPSKDQTKGHTGEVWYKVIGYADTVEEGQLKLYGRTYPLPAQVAAMDCSPSPTGATPASE